MPRFASIPAAPAPTLPRDECLPACCRQLFAIAIFDANGILEQAATVPREQPPQWLDAAFTTIGLKKLLSASLDHTGFAQAKIRTAGYTAWIGHRRRRYVTLLTRPLSWSQEQALDRYLSSLSLAQLIALIQQAQ